jgi:hypothetical protein
MCPNLIGIPIYRLGPLLYTSWPGFTAMLHHIDLQNFQGEGRDRGTQSSAMSCPSFKDFVFPNLP